MFLLYMVCTFIKASPSFCLQFVFMYSVVHHMSCLIIIWFSPITDIWNKTGHSKMCQTSDSRVFLLLLPFWLLLVKTDFYIYNSIYKLFQNIMQKLLAICSSLHNVYLFEL